MNSTIPVQPRDNIGDGSSCPTPRVCIIRLQAILARSLLSSPCSIDPAPEQDYRDAGGTTSTRRDAGSTLSDPLVHSDRIGNPPGSHLSRGDPSPHVLDSGENLGRPGHLGYTISYFGPPRAHVPPSRTLRDDISIEIVEEYPLLSLLC